MTDDDVVRIGRGLPAPKQAPKRWLGIKPEFVIAAAVVIAVAMMVSAVYFLDPPAAQVAAAPSPEPPAAIVVQCANIRHEYEVWARGKAELERLPQLQQYDAKYYVEHLNESAEAFYKAASGYPDRPSKELAVAVAAYRFEVTSIGIEVQLGPGKVSAAQHAKTTAAWAATEKAYKSFASSECAKAFAVPG